MSSDDWAREYAIDMLRHEAIMANATMQQCIYLFVEGESEEMAFPILLEKAGIDMEHLGVIMANYGGIGNLANSLRLLKRTLSHDRPIIVTYDNDAVGQKASYAIRKLGIKLDQITLFPIPSEPIVCYPCGHRGGSFEESFPVSDFVDASLSAVISEHEPSSLREEFLNICDSEQPWDPQLRKFLHSKGIAGCSPTKPDRAVELAESCTEFPETFSRLASLIQTIRRQHPIKHPTDAILPRIPGLTI